MEKKPLWISFAAFTALLVGLASTPALQAQTGQAQQGQQGATGSTSTMQDQGQTGSKSMVTATGCLQKSATGSGFQITDQNSNTTYDLVATGSRASDLSDHVGHTVTVSGALNNAAAADNSSSQAGSQPAGQSQTGNQQIDVKSVKVVSSSCQIR